MSVNNNDAHIHFLNKNLCIKRQLIFETFEEKITKNILQFFTDGCIYAMKGSTLRLREKISSTQREFLLALNYNS
mgnify:FL=1